MWQDLHGGHGVIQVRRYFEGAFKWPVELEIWEIAVGGAEGVHRHDASDPDDYDGVDECYLVIDGSGRFTIGDENFDIEAGNAVLVEPQTDRGVVNTGAVPLRMVVLSDMPSGEPAVDGLRLTVNRLRAPMGSRR